MIIIRTSLLFFCVSAALADYDESYNGGAEGIEDLSSAKAREAEQSSYETGKAAEDQDQPKEVDSPDLREANKEQSSTEEPKTKTSAPEAIKTDNTEVDAAKKITEDDEVKAEHESEKVTHAPTTTAAPAKEGDKKEPAAKKVEPVVAAVNPASRVASGASPRAYSPQGYYTPYNIPAAYGPYAPPGPYGFSGPHPAQRSFIPIQQWERQHGNPAAVGSEPAPAPQYAYHTVYQTQEPQVVAHEYPHYQYSYSVSAPQYSAPAPQPAPAAPQHAAPAPAPQYPAHASAPQHLAPAPAPFYPALPALYTPAIVPIQPIAPSKPEITAPAKPKPIPVKAPTTISAPSKPSDSSSESSAVSKPKPVPVGTPVQDAEQRSRYVWNCAIQPTTTDFRNDNGLEQHPLDQRASPVQYAPQSYSMPGPWPQQKYGNYYPSAGQDISLQGRQLINAHQGLAMQSDQPYYQQPQAMFMNQQPQGFISQPDEVRALEPQEVISQPEQAIAPQPQGFISQPEQFRNPQSQGLISHPGQLLYPQPLGPMAQPGQFRYQQPQGPINQMRYPQMPRPMPPSNMRNLRYQQPQKFVPGMPLSPEFLSKTQMRAAEQFNGQRYPQPLRSAEMGQERSMQQLNPNARQNYSPEFSRSAQMWAENVQRNAQASSRGPRPIDQKPKYTQEFQGSAKGWNVDVAGRFGPRNSQPSDQLLEQPSGKPKSAFSVVAPATAVQQPLVQAPKAAANTDEKLYDTVNHLLKQRLSGVYAALKSLMESNPKNSH